MYVYIFINDGEQNKWKNNPKFALPILFFYLSLSTNIGIFY